MAEAREGVAASGYRWLVLAMLAWSVGVFDGWRIFGWPTRLK